MARVPCDEGPTRKIEPHQLPHSLEANESQASVREIRNAPSLGRLPGIENCSRTLEIKFGRS